MSTPRPPQFQTALAQPPHAEARYVPPPPAPVVSPFTQAGVPNLPRHGRSASLWWFGLLGLVAVALVSYFLTFIGAGASLLGMVVALVPFAIVLVGVRLIDRWEPEPVGLMVLAIAWGAVASVALALAVDYALLVTLGPDRSTTGEVVQAVVQAPIVEELAKGLGLFLIFLIARRAFDGPVDGVVYGALVGAGFAFTENIQYFAISYLEGGAAQLTATFFLRGILSPFAHAMFTAVIGFALGLAARRGATAGQAVGPWLVGVVVAVALHAFWNGSAVLGDFLALYVMLQVPLFIGFILGILALRREETRLTRGRLGEYAERGWFTPEEVDMISTAAGRRRAIVWARSVNPERVPVMRAFIQDATGLAAARQRALTGRDPQASSDEAVLLARTAAARRALLAW